MKKGDMINRIITLVNSNVNGKRADADMFFSLAFMDETDLRAMCAKLGIKG